MHRLWDKVTDVAAASSNETTLRDALSVLCRERGFDWFAYLRIEDTYLSALSNYPKEWQRIYFERGYGRLDPVVMKARSTRLGFNWGPTKGPCSSCGDVQAFVAEAKLFGIQAGTTIPIRTAYGASALFTVASRDRSPPTTCDDDFISAAASVAQLHSRISRFKANLSSEETQLLTPKEACYLEWVARGKTMDVIAEIEDVKYNTVRINLENAKKRFGVYTLTHLTAIAIRRGLI